MTGQRVQKLYTRAKVLCWGGIRRSLKVLTGISFQDASVCVLRVQRRRLKRVVAEMSLFCENRFEKHRIFSYLLVLP